MMNTGSTRYLIFFQYIGTKYCGVVRSPAHYQMFGVQNHLEDAVRKLRPLSDVSLTISSRTDTGVHALSNSAHFDLQRRNNKPPFSEDVLVDALNFHLRQEPIRVNCAYRVPEGFHARFRATSRTYVYRLAAGVTRPSQLPLADLRLCWGLCNTELNVGAMREAASLLVGTHNFSSFRALNSETPFKDPVKTLDLVLLEPGEAFAHRHFHREIRFWELTFKSRSFLYKQVRRMTGALVAVGQGKLSISQLEKLLEAQDSLAYPQNLTAPPQGLFLTQVEYQQQDLRPCSSPVG
ncbi:tRNA pseudouridine synthase-like 1 isoform X2 [Hypomesus transpacificus]|uniref:tRNA pseudouridine synthase-like 1 isoform X2 n=1 Tax=Hypomesus transpacificus TaxID=137520 RepID=UPI001F07F1B3|nr:tRNA pseudouridine synthase-like 1 isoform X2 [Hypomesus transpacificus]